MLGVPADGALLGADDGDALVRARPDEGGGVLKRHQEGQAGCVNAE
jgi:hypothetical protein